jgi:hypothetical protein
LILLKEEQSFENDSGPGRFERTLSVTGHRWFIHINPQTIKRSLIMKSTIQFQHLFCEFKVVRKTTLKLLIDCHVELFR